MEKFVKSKTHRDDQHAAADRSVSRHGSRGTTGNTASEQTQAIPLIQRESGDAQANLINRIDNSPRVTEKRQLLDRAFGESSQPRLEEQQSHHGASEALQRQPEEEEPLQGRLDAAQREPEEEELMQGKFDVLQRQTMDDEELLQGKFATLQKQPVEDEPLQGASADPSISVPGKHVQENRTGMPDQLKAGIESLSGEDISDVRVHENSDQPARVDALAYAQGTEIFLGPGQTHHLPHEAWHIVQQRQGRVRSTRQLAGKQINDDPSLEREADVMGAQALMSGVDLASVKGSQLEPARSHAPGSSVRQPIQLMRLRWPWNTDRRMGESPAEAQARKDLNRTMTHVRAGQLGAGGSIAAAIVLALLGIATVPASIVGAGLGVLGLGAATYARYRAGKVKKAASEQHLVKYGEQDGQLAMSRVPQERREDLSKEWIDNLKASRAEWRRRRDLGLKPKGAEDRIRQIDQAIVQLEIHRNAHQSREAMGYED